MPTISLQLTTVTLLSKEHRYPRLTDQSVRRVAMKEAEKYL